MKVAYEMEDGQRWDRSTWRFGFAYLFN
jgi:hypothetical protein